MTTLFEQPPDEAHFDGPEPDAPRLTGQLLRTWEVMNDHKWRTTTEISQITHDPPTSIQAQLRHLRKERFGAYLVECRRRGNRYEYRVGQRGEGTPKHVECTHCALLEGRIEDAVHKINWNVPKAEILAALRGYHLGSEEVDDVMYGAEGPNI